MGLDNWACRLSKCFCPFSNSCTIGAHRPELRADSFAGVRESTSINLRVPKKRPDKLYNRLSDRYQQASNTPFGDQRSAVKWLMRRINGHHPSHVYPTPFPHAIKESNNTTEIN